MSHITPDEKRRILGLFYQGNSRARIADIVSHSSATVHRVIKTHERDVRENGLIYELSEERLTEPLELARLYSELQAAGVSVPDCRDAVPIVQRCRVLGLEEGQVNALIDAAVRLGEPEFSREQFAQSLLRIIRREQETGQSIEQIESTHNRLSRVLQKLQSDEGALRTSINQLQAQRTDLETRIRNGQEKLAGVERRLAKVPVTEAQLEAYVADKNFLASFGLNMNDLPRAGFVLVQFQAFNYNTTAIINELVRVRNLNTTITTLTKNASDLQASLAKLGHEKENLAKEIQELENKRDQVKKGLQKEEDEAHKTIMDSKCAVIEQLAKAKVTEQELADFVAARQALRKGGVPL